MEKLIKLLNEFLKKEDKSIYTFYWNQVFNCIHRGNGERSDNEWICSKKFGFIKWLVENDKIDMRKAKYHSDYIYYQDYGEGGWACKDYEFVIMLLSISDTPIEDLILFLNIYNNE